MRSASALQGAGNTLEESIGLITAANSVVQNPESVGTAMKTLTMYLRAAKTELEEAGEDAEGCASSVSELREELKALSGVDIMIDDDTFKSTTQIIRELSKVWDDLTGTTQANITELIGGKRNANVLQAMIKNFRDAEKAIETASNSAGSALRENEKYLDGIAGKTDLIKGKAQELSNGIIGSGAVKFVLDLVNGTLDLANALNKIHLLLPTIGVVATLGATKGMVGDVADVTGRILSAIQVKGASAVEIAGQFQMKTEALSKSQKKVIANLLNTAAKGNDAQEAIAKDIDKLLGLTQATEGLEGAAESTSLSLKQMFDAVPLWTKVLGGVSIVTGIIGGITAIIQYVDELKEKMIETANTAKESYAFSG